MQASLIAPQEKASVCAVVEDYYLRPPQVPTLSSYSPPTTIMESERQQSPPELTIDAESGRHSAPTSPSPHAEGPPSANLYEALEDGQIRLFELGTSITGNIVGRLRNVEMSSASSFYALSYVCGSDAYSEEITIDNHAVLIRPNLYAALEELRSHFQDRHIAQVAIWIDALCIDQVNEEEKAKQIRKMHSVFSGAQEVLVWLGAVDDNIRMVLRVFAWIGSFSELRPHVEAYQNEPGYLDSIGPPKLKALQSLFLLQDFLEAHHRVSVTHLVAMIGFLDTWRFFIRDDNLSRLGIGIQIDEAIIVAMVPISNAGIFPPDHIFWATLYAFLDLEWFGRAWTYQEILLAREAKLLAQGVCVPWMTVVECMDVLLKALTFLATFNERTPSRKIKDLPSVVERTKAMMMWTQFHNHPPSAVLYSLILTKRRVGTIARDNVYGLIALWQSNVQAEVVIDYTRATAEVFANAVKTGLKMEKTPTIADLWTAFEGSGRSIPASATEGLPSWCPDFHHPVEYPDATGYSPLSLAVRDRIRAFARYEHTPSFETIAVRVLKLDTIAKTVAIACPSTPQRPDERTDEHYFAMIAWLQELLGVLRSETLADRGLTYDFRETGFQVYREDYEDADILRLAPGFTFDVFLANLARLATLLPSQLANALQDVDLRFTLDMLSHHTGRFHFLTNSGRIGYSARRPCLNGHIILVPCNVPGPLHMLTADCTQYVGCADVIELMGDSLLESLEEMENKWEMVVLR